MAVSNIHKPLNKPFNSMCDVHSFCSCCLTITSFSSRNWIDWKYLFIYTFSVGKYYMKITNSASFILNWIWIQKCHCQNHFNKSLRSLAAFYCTFVIVWSELVRKKRETHTWDFNLLFFFPIIHKQIRNWINILCSHTFSDSHTKTDPLFNV